MNTEVWLNEGGVIFGSTPSATVRSLRLPLALGTHNDLLVALQDFTQAVWSDERLPSAMRQDLQAQYDNVVQRAILRARLLATDHLSDSSARSVAYTQQPWVVERSVAGELEPFTTDGVHLLSGEGDKPLPLEEREANGRLIGAAQRHDVRLRATTAFLRRLVSAHPDEIADYMAIAVAHLEENIVALAAIEADANTIPPASEPYLQILEDYWTAIEAVPANAIDPVLMGLAETLGIEAEPLRIAYNYRKRMGEVGATHMEQPLPAEEYAVLRDSRTGEYPTPQRPAESPVVAGFDAASVIITRVTEVRDILRDRGWDGPRMGELCKEVGATTLGFDHKVDLVDSGRNVDLHVAYIARETSETEHTRGAAPLVKLRDPMDSSAEELVSRFEAELEVALRARGLDVDLQQGSTRDELGPR